jgi:hypothetical protein
MKNYKNYWLTIVAVATFFVVGAIIAWPWSNSRAAANISLTVNDLIRAGFSQVKVMSPATSGRFSGLNQYFSVSDKVSSPASEAPNIVMVSDLSLPYPPSSTALFKYGADSQAFSIIGGQGQEATLTDGRVAINFIKSSNYVVIIGPNRSKIETLAVDLAGKIQ